MIRLLMDYAVSGAVILPVLFFYKKEKVGYRLFFLFFAFLLIHNFLLTSPYIFRSLVFTSGKWNWSGKIYAIIGSIIFYFLFRDDFSENDFLKLRQREGSLRFTLTFTVLYTGYALIAGYFFSQPLPFNFETLGFKLTMPGLDEELAFRGVMLGLLATALSDRIKIGNLDLGHPAMWITAVLFGLGHGLHGRGFSIVIDMHMNWAFFGGTFAYGLILAWFTLKSGSILIPIVVHNLGVFSYKLAQMLQ